MFTAIDSFVEFGAGGDTRTEITALNAFMSVLLQVKALRSFDTSGTTFRATRRHIPPTLKVLSNTAERTPHLA